MWWPFGLSIIVLLAASARGERATWLYVVAVAYAVSVAVGYSAPDHVSWPFVGGLWVIVGAMVAFLTYGNYSISAILTMVAGILVFPARLMGAEYEIGQPFLVASECAGLAGALFLRWPDALGRIRSLGDYSRRIYASRRAGDQGAAKKINQ